MLVGKIIRHRSDETETLDLSTVRRLVLDMPTHFDSFEIVFEEWGKEALEGRKQRQLIAFGGQGGSDCHLDG
ncbi:MAG: hypothetical protein KDA80_18980 [Planctomycetaceae bacterium]|nr:hypothetical protein [Planctomycetaceae bacterium]